MLGDLIVHTWVTWVGSRRVWNAALFSRYVVAHDFVAAIMFVLALPDPILVSR